jgi:hypothetical protein
MLVASGPVRPTILFGEGEAPAAPYSQSLTIKPGSLTGQVLYPDGETPAANVPIRVWSVVDKKFIYEGTTDEKGMYRIPALGPGQYVVIAGDRVRVEVVVSDAASTTGKPLNIIIPRGKAFFSTQELEAELAGGAAPGQEKLLRSVLVFSAAAVTAVGVLWATGALGGEGGGRNVVSP